MLGCVSVFLCVVLSCVGKGLGAGLVPRPTKCLKGSISKKEIPTPEKGIRKNEKEEEEHRSLPQASNQRQMKPVHSLPPCYP
jgi:hypothetical protein